MSGSQSGRPGFGETLLRGFCWGTAMAFGSAIAGPVAPVIILAAKAMMGGAGDGDDGGGVDFS